MKSMLAYVLRGLERSKGNWTHVAEASGVPKRTLEKIARREIEDPGISHIQRLFNYFTKLEKSALRRRRVSIARSLAARARCSRSAVVGS